MPDFTNHYGLEKLGPNESFSTNSYQFTEADRDTIDTVLSIGAETHHHNGSTPGTTTVVAPSLALITTSGTLPAGTRVYYKISLVDPSGLETAASPEAYIDTPVGVASPGSPTLTTSPVGTLPPGGYYYALTAYKGTTTQETLAGPPAFINVSTASAGNRITVEFPVLPTGADGFNIYRRRPGQGDFYLIVSVASPTTFFNDNGTVENCDLKRPTANSTTTSNSVDVHTYATLDPGWTWNIYRTMVANNYTNSFLKRVSDETSPGSGVVVTTHRDTGTTTFIGQPSTVSRIPNSPAKVTLTSGSEVAGRLPLGYVQCYPIIVSFSFPGQQRTVSGTNTWVCEFPYAWITGVRAVLGRGSSPGGQDLIVDVNRQLSGQVNNYVSIFTTQGNRPRIFAGFQIGGRAIPDVQQLVTGDSLTCDVDQAGLAATPTDRDLIINVSMLAYFTNTLSDYNWS